MSLAHAASFCKRKTSTQLKLAHVFASAGSNLISRMLHAGHWKVALLDVRPAVISKNRKYVSRKLTARLQDATSYAQQGKPSP